MIQLDLTPDVKQELLRAERIRNQVVTISILLTMVLVGIVLILAFISYVVQPGVDYVQTKNIEKESKELSGFKDINKLVTLQNQLKVVGELHDKKHVNSRALVLLNVINPTEPNKVSFSSVNVDTDNNIITLEAQSSGGYRALEALKKTIESTIYKTEEDQDGRPIGSNIQVIDSSFGEDNSGNKSLRFSLSFEYDPEMLLATSRQVTFKGPDREDATDSNQGLPKSLFEAPLKTDKENQEGQQ